MNSTKMSRIRSHFEGLRSWDGLYQFLAVLTFGCLLYPLYAMEFPVFSLGRPVGILLLLLLLLFGYTLGFLSNIWKPRKDYDFSYEGREAEKITLVGSLVPILLIVALAFAGKAALEPWFQMQSWYSPHSTRPWEALGLLALAPICGALLAQLPFYKIVSLKTVFSQLIFFAGLTILIMQLNIGLYDLVAGFLCWLALSALLLNQNYLLKSVKQAGSRSIPPYFRIYNFGMAGLAVLLGFLLFILLAMLFNGIFLVGKILLYIILAAAMNQEAHENDTVIDTTVSESGLIGDGLFEDLTMNYASIWMFLLFFILALILIIFGRKYHIFSRFAQLLAKLYEAITAWFEQLFAFRKQTKNTTMVQGPEDFVDVERKQDRAAIFHRSASGRRLKYQDFQREFSKQKNDPERFAFTYYCFTIALKELQIGIRPSDTPREICEKLQRHLSFENSAEITHLFEEIKYARRDPDEKRLLAPTKKMIEIIQKYSD